MSAAERHVVGCPLPALLVEATESILSWVAMSRSAATEVAAMVSLLSPEEERDFDRPKRAVYHSAVAVSASTSSAASGPASAAS